MFSLRWRVLRPFVLAGICALVLTGCGPSASDSGDGGGSDDELVFASIPSENSTSLEQGYQPIIDMLEKETGKKITFQNATNYAAIIEGQRAGKIDIAMYGPFSYVLARNSGVRATPVAAQVEDKGEMPGYQSYGVVKSGSPIRDLAGMKGKKVCFVDPNSTSGYLYPRAGLIESGVNPGRDISPVMAGGHDASALGVASGQCDAGFATDTMVEKQLIAKGQLKQGELSTIWKSEVIAGSPIAVSDDLNPKLKQRITKALQRKANVDHLRAAGFCGADCVAGEQGKWGFAQVDDSFYDGVRKVCRITADKQCTES